MFHSFISRRYIVRLRTLLADLLFLLVELALSPKSDGTEDARLMQSHLNEDI